MRLVTYRDRDRSIKPGVLQGEEIVDISDQVADVSSLIEEGPGRTGRATELSARQDALVFRLRRWNCWLRSKTRRASSALDWHIAITPLKRIRRSPKFRRSS